MVRTSKRKAPLQLDNAGRATRPSCAPGPEAGAVSHLQHTDAAPELAGETLSWPGVVEGVRPHPREQRHQSTRCNGAHCHHGDGTGARGRQRQRAVTPASPISKSQRCPNPPQPPGWGSLQHDASFLCPPPRGKRVCRNACGSERACARSNVVRRSNIRGFKTSGWSPPLGRALRMHSCPRAVPTPLMQPLFPGGCSRTLLATGALALLATAVAAPSKPKASARVSHCTRTFTPPSPSTQTTDLLAPTFWRGVVAVGSPCRTSARAEL